MFESSELCVKRPFKTRNVLAFQRGGRLLLNECYIVQKAPAGAFLRFFHSAISSHMLQRFPCHLNGLPFKTGLTVVDFIRYDSLSNMF